MITIVPSWKVVIGFNSLTRDELSYEFYAINHTELLQLIQKIKFPIFKEAGPKYITISRNEY